MGFPAGLVALVVPAQVVELPLIVWSGAEALLRVEALAICAFVVVNAQDFVV